MPEGVSVDHCKCYKVNVTSSSFSLTGEGELSPFTYVVDDCKDERTKIQILQMSISIEYHKYQKRQSTGNYIVDTENNTQQKTKTKAIKDNVNE